MKPGMTKTFISTHLFLLCHSLNSNLRNTIHTNQSVKTKSKT